MKKILLSIISLFIVFISYSQSNKRIEISGKIVVEENDVEGVTIFNSSSNKGTITNEKGEFYIDVMLNDLIEISALQFEPFSVIVSNEVIKSRQLTVFLIERINKLDEVVILPYGLSGNLKKDIENVETFNPDLDAIYFGVSEIGSYEFSEDYKSKVENIAMNRGQLNYGIDFIGITSTLLKPLFKSKKKNKQTPQEIKNEKLLTDIYAKAYMSKSFNIPEDKIDEFIEYVENNGLNKTHLDEDKEVYLIEFLVSARKQFLKDSSDKN